MENVGQKEEGRPIRMLCIAALDFWRELSDLNPDPFIIKIFQTFQISTNENEYPHHVTPSLDADSEARTRLRCHIAVGKL